jgi:rhodanese-related sulfurtransferase
MNGMRGTTIIHIHPLDVKEKLERGEPVQIVDVREFHEVARGKIPGAKHIPLGEIADRMHEIDPDAETIMVCRSGSRSGMACEFLMRQGYKNVKNMMGGMLIWDGPVE